MGPIRGMLSEVGMTEQQWRVLRVLEEEGPLDPTRIAELACLLLPSLPRILQKLEDKGLIDRRPDPEDRRKQIVQISPTGKELIEANLPTAVKLNDRVREQLGPEKYETLLDLLNDLHRLPQD